jgi:hypothetical protein
MTMYMLDEHGEPVPVDDIEIWGRWWQQANRIVAQDKDEAAGAAGVMVSTVFLGLDHNFSTSGPPVLWETLVFGGPLDGEMDRYTSRAAALAGHQAMCRRVSEARRP